MNPSRPFVGVLAVLGTSVAAFGLCFWLAARVRFASAERQSDELSWLGHEFHLSDADLALIRPLHQVYQSKCEEMCARLAVKNRELALTLKGATNVGPSVEQKLGEIASLRAECQAQMLRHFQAIAQTMPGDQGPRYLAEMQRLTLGLPGTMENLMAHPTHEHR